MFTGIIRQIGTLGAARKTPDGISMTISAAGFSEFLRPGDSVAVNGVCLTAERCDANNFTATVVGETLEKTTLGKLLSGTRVNLEGAATPTTAMGGHLVQGHVDGIGKIKSFLKKGKDRLLTVALPEVVYGYMVPKGSITIDGISLTVVDRLPGRAITITIVPFTLEHTIAGSYRSGSEVNVEVDIIGKYVKHYLNQTQ